MKKLINTIKASLGIRTPETLLQWMTANLKYTGLPKEFLYTPEEILVKKEAHCWEACTFAYKYLTDMGFVCTLVYMESKNAAVTHSTLFFSSKEDKTCHWFEWVWGAQRGIHAYRHKQELIEVLAAKFKQANGSIVVMSEGHTLVKEHTLQDDYYIGMSKYWERLSPRYTLISPK